MKCLVVTGASRGIGRYLCEQLSNEYEVVGLARNPPGDTGFRFAKVDVTDNDQIKAAIKKLSLQRIYGLINCAGIASMNLFMTTPQDTVRRIFEVNTIGTMNACSALLPSMIRYKEGRIINFSTIAVRLGLEGESVYAASKAAVEAFGRVLAKEVSKYSITVNTVSPNPIETDLIAGVDKGKIDSLVDRQAVKRKGEVEDVLNVVRFYLDAKSSLITGQNIVLGGY